MESRLKNAKELEENGNFDEAINLYAEEYNDFGEEWVCVKVAEILLKVGRVEDASKWITKVEDTENEFIAQKIFEFYFQTDEMQKASDAAARLFPSLKFKGKMSYGDKFFLKGAYAQAQYWYGECGERSAQSIDGRYLSKHGEFMREGDEEIHAAQKARFLEAEESYAVQNYKEGARLYWKLMRRGSKYCARKYADCLFMLKEYGKAAKQYRELINEFEGDCDLMFMLGECYNSDLIDDNTYENTVYWYEYALSSGSKKVFYHLGMCYQIGRGCERDLGKAEDLYRKGMKYDYDKYGCMCKIGNIMLEQDKVAEAEKYYREAAVNGSAAALVNLALLGFTRPETEMEPDEIICLLLKARALGNKRAKQILIELGSGADSGDLFKII